MRMAHVANIMYTIDYNSYNYNNKLYYCEYNQLF